MPAPRFVSFDRAATYYDATRGLNPDAMQKVVALLTEEIGGRGPCLEVGIGTGRIGLTLWEAGVDMAGVDLSPAMLATLINKAGGVPPFPLAVADATRLPFPDATFDVCLVCHVLHLIPEWKGSLAEMARVLRPGGRILVDPGPRPNPRTSATRSWKSSRDSPATRTSVQASRRRRRSTQR
jgi:ubiquinone/menaquinone biosynthesis C-methylase UbiE